MKCLKNFYCFNLKKFTSGYKPLKMVTRDKFKPFEPTDIQKKKFQNYLNFNMDNNKVPDKQVNFTKEISTVSCSVFNSNEFLKENPKIIIKNNKTKEDFQKDQNKKGFFLKMQKDTDIFDYSQHKLNEVAVKLKNQYFEDVDSILKNTHTKGSRLIKGRLEKFKNENKELFENNGKKYFLYIKQAIVGASKGKLKFHYRAKGRVNKIRSRNSTILLQFVKISKNAICKKMAAGKTPLFIRHRIREYMYKKRASLNEIRLMRLFSTSHGNKSRRIMIKNEARQLREEYIRKKNIKLNNSLLRNDVVENMIDKLKPLYDKYIIKEENIKKDEKNVKKTGKSVASRTNIFNSNLKYNY